LKNLTIFSNDEIVLIIGNIGVENARYATQMIINHYDISDDDIFINVGICGANKEYEISRVLEIGAINYNEIQYIFDKKKIEILCADEAVEQTGEYDCADMESFGFYDAIIHNPAIKKFHIFKIVSDHFEPNKVTKEKAKLLISNNIDKITELI